ncbi:hypothetical protein AMTRI_Chr11g158320 [Amborella trichopoda]
MAPHSLAEMEHLFFCHTLKPSLYVVNSYPPTHSLQISFRDPICFLSVFKCRLILFVHFCFFGVSFLISKGPILSYFSYFYFFFSSFMSQFHVSLTNPSFSFIYRYDEWNDPLEAALSGGRGMFCILPLAKALTNTTCRSINFAMESALQMVEKRDFGFSFELFKTGVDDQFQKFKASMKRNNFNLLTMRKENVDLGSHWKEKV